MEKMQKVSFSIPSKPRPPKTATRPAAFAAAAGHSGPAPRFFVTTFDPSKSLTPAPAPLVIPPLPNTLNPTAGDGPAFVLAASADASSSSLGYGLTVRDTAAAAAAAGEPSGGDLTLRRFNDDMATLPDIQGAEEYEEVPVEGFGAALLAGYGWKKGDPIGRDKSKRDAKAVERGRRFGTQGLGSDPSKETASPSRSRRPLPAGREENMSSKKKKKKQRLE